MNEKQVKFLELAVRYEQLKAEMDSIRNDLGQVMAELGVGTYVQDPELLTVYKIVKPSGTFIYYRDIDYVRTALKDERAGTLSKKEATEAGFTVLGK